ncbi:hypothetical protein AGMMS49992_24980 [Clostridia bacterium]|nr:hypothetical protein AGMMS49992_24980 [Clostridia bacterium]
MTAQGNGAIYLPRRAKSRSISAENPTGGKGMGAMAEHGTGKESARDFGVGWKVNPSIVIEPGETALLADIQDSGVIRTMWLTGCLGRDYIFRIYWDDQQQPSVECPLPDFFGCGWQDAENKIPMEFAPIDSAMIAVNPCNGFNSFFPMPFRKRCRITVENRNIRKAHLYYQINYELCDVEADALYFHAQWRRTNPVPTMDTHVLLDGISGAGHYVGTMLNVGINGPNLWWGEGEIKFFLDDDYEHPTICGTGTEDYFGGAWGWDVNGKYTAYTTQYMGVHIIHEPKGGEDCQQRFSMYRWHTLDPVIFEQSLRVTIQDLGWRRNGKYYLGRNDDFSSVAYWYQTLPTAPFRPLPDRNGMEII